MSGLVLLFDSGLSILIHKENTDLFVKIKTFCKLFIVSLCFEERGQKPSHALLPLCDKQSTHAGTESSEFKSERDKFDYV